MSKKLGLRCNNVPVRVCPAAPDPPKCECVVNKIKTCIPDQVVIETIRKALDVGATTKRIEPVKQSSFISVEHENDLDEDKPDYADLTSLPEPQTASFAEPEPKPAEPPIPKRKTAFSKWKPAMSVKPSTQTTTLRSKKRLSTYLDPENFGLLNEHHRNSSFVLLKKTPNDGMRPTVRLVRLHPVPVVRTFGIRELNEVSPPTYFEELNYWKTGPGRQYYSNATININNNQTSANPSVTTFLSEDKIALVNGQYSDPSQIELSANVKSNEGYYHPST